MPRIIVPSGGGGGGTGLEEIEVLDFTSCTDIDLSAAGTHNVLKDDGSTALATIVTTHDASGAAISGTKNVDCLDGQGIVVDVTSGSGGQNVVLAVALPTTLKANFDADLLMFEWVISGVAITGTNNSLAKFKVSTTADLRGTPSNGLVAIKSSAASGFDCKAERQYNTSVTRSAANQTFAGGNLHVQYIMRRQSGMVYQDTGTDFSAPHSPSISYGLGARSFPANVPLGATSAPQWSAPYMVLMADCNTTSDRCQFVVEKFRLCKFSPSVN
jgi:hypothetical protein